MSPSLLGSEKTRTTITFTRAIEQFQHITIFLYTISVTMFSKAIILAAVVAFTTSVVAKTGDMTFFTPVSFLELLKLTLCGLL